MLSFFCDFPCEVSSFACSSLDALDERDVVALEENLSERTTLLLLFLGSKLHLDCIVDNKVHELVKAANLALDPQAHLFEKPNLYGCAGLKELEDEVDRRQQDLVTVSTTAAGHCEGREARS